jgi:hypothetical protein
MRLNYINRPYIAATPHWPRTTTKDIDPTAAAVAGRAVTDGGRPVVESGPVKVRPPLAPPAPGREGRKKVAVSVQGLQVVSAV